jgi:hypothetical protein
VIDKLRTAAEYDASNVERREILPDEVAFKTGTEFV